MLFRRESILLMMKFLKRSAVWNGRSDTVVKLTNEQLHIVNHNVQAREVIKIIAFAGTGKTTTLVRYTQMRLFMKFLLVVYNRSDVCAASLCCISINKSASYSASEIRVCSSVHTVSLGLQRTSMIEDLMEGLCSSNAIPLSYNPYKRMNKRSEEVDDLQLVGCCSKKCVKTKLKLTKSGYVPGERIQLDASCDNQTQKSLDQAYVNLFMNITLKTEKKDLVVQKIIRSWSVPEIPPQTHLSLDDLQLTVPPLPSSGSRYCNNIDIHYTLQFTVELSNDVCCTSSLSLIVGNVPLESCANQYTGNEGANVAKVNNQQLPNEIQKRLLNSAVTKMVNGIQNLYPPSQ
uniref:F-box only protein 18 n=1 Tax=Magallana gigas TaxID=29159 RepID=K1Q939_MAGGI